MFRVLEHAQQSIFPGAITLPLMLTGATDSAQLREKGVQAYGLGTLATEAEGATLHGNDEKVSVEGLGRFLRYLYTAVIEIAATPGK